MDNPTMDNPTNLATYHMATISWTGWITYVKCNFLSSSMQFLLFFDRKISCTSITDWQWIFSRCDAYKGSQEPVVQASVHFRWSNGNAFSEHATYLTGLRLFVSSSFSLSFTCFFANRTRSSKEILHHSGPGHVTYLCVWLLGSAGRRQGKNLHIFCFLSGLVTDITAIAVLQVLLWKQLRQQHIKYGIIDQRI